MCLLKDVLELSIRPQISHLAGLLIFLLCFFFQCTRNSSVVSNSVLHIRHTVSPSTGSGRSNGFLCLLTGIGLSALQYGMFVDFTTLHFMFPSRQILFGRMCLILCVFIVCFMSDNPVWYILLHSGQGNGPSL